MPTSHSKQQHTTKIDARNRGACSTSFQEQRRQQGLHVTRPTDARAEEGAGKNPATPTTIQNKSITVARMVLVVRCRWEGDAARIRCPKVFNQTGPGTVSTSSSPHMNGTWRFPTAVSVLPLPLSRTPPTHPTGLRGGVAGCSCFSSPGLRCLRSFLHRLWSGHQEGESSCCMWSM